MLRNNYYLLRKARQNPVGGGREWGDRKEKDTGCGSQHRIK